jgi:hypothetical protein
MLVRHAAPRVADDPAAQAPHGTSPPAASTLTLLPSPLPPRLGQNGNLYDRDASTK